MAGCVLTPPSPCAQGKRILERYRARKRRGDSVAGLLFNNDATPSKNAKNDAAEEDKENFGNGRAGVQLDSPVPARPVGLSLRTTPVRAAQALLEVASTPVPRETGVSALSPNAGGEARDLLQALDRALSAELDSGAAETSSAGRGGGAEGALVAEKAALLAEAQRREEVFRVEIAAQRASLSAQEEALQQATAALRQRAEALEQDKAAFTHSSSVERAGAREEARGELRWDEGFLREVRAEVCEEVRREVEEAARGTQGAALAQARAEVTQEARDMLRAEVRGEVSREVREEAGRAQRADALELESERGAVVADRIVLDEERAAVVADRLVLDRQRAALVADRLVRAPARRRPPRAPQLPLVAAV